MWMAFVITEQMRLDLVPYLDLLGADAVAEFLREAICLDAARKQVTPFDGAAIDCLDRELPDGSWLARLDYDATCASAFEKMKAGYPYGSAGWMSEAINGYKEYLGVCLRPSRRGICSPLPANDPA